MIQSTKCYFIFQECVGIKANRSATFQIFRWSSFVLNPETASDVSRSEESGTMSFSDSVNQLSNVIHLILPLRKTPNIFHIDGDDVINTTLKYLFIDTYKATHSHCDYNRHCSIIGLYYSCIKNSIFNLNLRQKTSLDLNLDL